MAKFTGILEQAEGGSWSAYTLAPTVAIGTGPTKEEALADLRSGIRFWLVYMKETGQPTPLVSSEIVSFEVAA